jgi:hypothetical protein
MAVPPEIIQKQYPELTPRKITKLMDSRVDVMMLAVTLNSDYYAFLFSFSFSLISVSVWAAPTKTSELPLKLPAL